MPSRGIRLWQFFFIRDCNYRNIKIDITYTGLKYSFLISPYSRPMTNKNNINLFFSQRFFVTFFFVLFFIILNSVRINFIQQKIFYFLFPIHYFTRLRLLHKNEYSASGCTQVDIYQKPLYFYNRYWKE